MNGWGKRFLIVMQPCSIVLLTLFVAASARAQTSGPAPANDDRSDTSSELPLATHFRLPSVLSGSSAMPADRTIAKINQGILNEFVKAWCISGGGTNGREGVVLIFRMADGSYTGKLQGFTNQYNKVTFKWSPTALAIVHTHPNSSDPRPGEQDKLVADKFGVPNFTITISGMYVYDPVTKETSKVLDGLDWLELSAYTRGLKRWLGE